MTTAAILALADGSLFKGRAIGYPGSATGEVVFNTAMTGYQEILTDPSYAKQMVTLTYPHIGNVGCNAADQESNQTWASGLIIRDLSLTTSNYRAEISLSDYLLQHKVVAIADIDTRQLTRLLAEKGAQNGCISLDVAHPEKAIAAAKASVCLAGLDLAKQVSCQQQYIWSEGNNGSPHIVAYDFGVKHNILRLLAERNCRITIVPAQTSAKHVLALQPDGIFLSNGPGDPAACDYAIEAIKQFLHNDIPMFGICLGFQLLGLACGAQSKKMKFGHHGANHPVRDEAKQSNVYITSQNHGFCLDEGSLPTDLIITHRSLFDNTLQGIRHKYKPAFGFQGHPEASPGPHDIVELFDQFIEMMN